MAECLERPCETGIDLIGVSNALGQDLRRLIEQLGGVRWMLMGLLVVLVSGALVVVLNERAQNAALPSTIAERSPAAVSLSGDDAYDPAAGSVLARLSRSPGGSLSGDDLYDPATGARPARTVRAAIASLSGDDAYDPAAGSRFALLSQSSGGTLSGDDLYDPATGARPARALYAAPASLSGDDAYDPASGGLTQ